MRRVFGLLLHNGLIYFYLKYSHGGCDIKEGIKAGLILAISCTLDYIGYPYLSILSIRWCIEMKTKSSNITKAGSGAPVSPHPLQDALNSESELFKSLRQIATYNEFASKLDKLTDIPSILNHPDVLWRNDPLAFAQSILKASKGLADFYGLNQNQVLFGVEKSAENEFHRFLVEAAQLYREKRAEIAKANLEALVNIYAHDITIPRYSLREAKMIAKAQEKVILSTQWVTAADISDMVGFKSTNKSAGPAKWKASNKIFSVRYRSEELFPIYALDKSNGFNPVSGLKPILELFKGVKDSWGIAYWFAGANGFLGGTPPQDLLQSEPALVLEAAKDELQGVTHG